MLYALVALVREEGGGRVYWQGGFDSVSALTETEVSDTAPNISGIIDMNIY